MPDDTDTELQVRSRIFPVIQSAVGLGHAKRLLDRGDGTMAILPGTSDATKLLTDTIPAVVQAFDTLPESTMRLRFALHAGHVWADRYGYMSQPLITAFRILHSAELDHYSQQLERSMGLVALTDVVSYNGIAATETPSTLTAKYGQSIDVRLLHIGGAGPL